MQGVFEGGTKPETPAPVDVKELHAKIGQLALENDAPQGLRGPTGATVPASISGALDKAGLLIRCTAAHARMCESGAQSDDRAGPQTEHRQAGIAARDQ